MPSQCAVHVEGPAHPLAETDIAWERWSKVSKEHRKKACVVGDSILALSGLSPNSICSSGSLPDGYKSDSPLVC